MSKGVEATHASYDKYLPQWIRCRDAVDGHDAVKSRTTAYLPKLTDQSPEDYKSYLMRAPFYNASGRTVGGMIGMLFRKPPTKVVPAGIEKYLTDIDLAGTPFDIFAQFVSQEIIETNRVGVLVDFPTKPFFEAEKEVVLTVALAEDLNLRPVMKMYNTESIINWRFKQINNAWTLCMVVLKEHYDQPVDEFSNSCVDQWRVLDLEDDTKYRVRVFRKASQNDIGIPILQEVIYPSMNSKTLNFIPFKVITSEGTTFDVEEPPLIDLVDTNFSHYRTSADYEHGCHFTGLPTLFIAGYQAVAGPPGMPEPKIYLGSQAAITMRDPQARAGYVEFTGQGLTSLKDNLDRKENQMAVLGARMLFADKKQTETATTAAIHRTGENSVLASISVAVSQGLAELLNIFSEWAGFKADCEYKLNKIFMPITIDAPTLTAYITAWQASALNDEELFDLLQEGEIIDNETTIDDHKNGTFSGAPPAPVAAPGTPKTKLNNPANQGG